METDDSKTLATETTKATETSTKSEPKTPLVSIYVLYSVAENVGFFVTFWMYNMKTIIYFAVTELCINSWFYW